MREESHYYLQNELRVIHIPNLQIRVLLLAPLAETGFNYRLNAYKIVGHLFGLSYRKIWVNNQVENMFFKISNISAPFPNVQLRGRTVITKLWTFFGPWGRDCSQLPHVGFSGKASKSIHGLDEDDTGSIIICYF